MTPLTIRYPVRPVRRSLATNLVADLFGLAADEPDLTVADRLAIDPRPGDLVLFTGPSGSGKSSLLRAVGREFGAVDAATLDLPDIPLIDALGGPIEDRLKLLAACGLSEARTLLRTPTELSDGQRYRFRLAFALATGARWLIADEFAAHLDRTLAKVVAFNLRKLVTRTGVGMLLATTHDDLTADLRPDLHVHCLGDGDVRAARDDTARTARPISFAGELRVDEGSAADWSRFAKWHYRSHRLPFVRRVVLLKHGDEPVGVCAFTAPAAGLALRTWYFGLTAPRARVALQALNDQVWLLARVVLHPTYRGAGVGAAFVRRACVTCPVRWVEALTALGHANPVFDRAGFARVGVVGKPARGGYGRQFGPGGKCSRSTAERSRFAAPVYYVFENRPPHPPAPSPTRGEGEEDRTREARSTQVPPSPFMGEGG